MSIIPIKFRTTDADRWGTVADLDLEPFEVDRNFWELKTALENAITNPPSPVEIVSFAVQGVGFLITLSNGNVVGPLPLPVLAWRWRADWMASVPYAALDVFIVADVGVFMVLLDHTSDSVFDPDAVDAGNNRLYQELFPLVPRAPLPLFYDFAGVPASGAKRNLVAPFGGTLLAPVFCFFETQATADAVFTVNVISAGTTTAVGTIEVISTQPNSANFNQTSPPVVVLSNAALQLVAPGSPDATLADLSFTLLLQPN